jgi:hypothetical protein
MCNDDFKHIEDFEDILTKAKQKIDSSKEGYSLNFSLKVSFSISLVQNPQLIDSSELAKDFQNPERPDTLYMNHGEYIKPEGILNVIHNLMNKHNGNRAIISLINQDKILGSGDEPIPSFMILQFCIEDNILYVTTYFRALEVESFLRINVEEIRLIINQIYQSIRTIKFVCLNIFSFRAYSCKDINPLKKPEIELMDSILILKLMEKKPQELIRLLKEKLKPSTVVKNESLQIIYDIIIDDRKNDSINSCFKTSYIKTILKSCLEHSTALINLRKTASHDTQIDDLSSKYISSLNELISEIGKCQ